MAKAVVIGAGFGGIASALRLASHGHEVTVVEKLPNPGGRAQVFEKNGFKHDAGPTVITAPFLFDELFSLFNKKREDYVDFKPLNPWYRFVYPDNTQFNYGGSVEDTLKEISKINPSDCKGYEKLLKKSHEIYKIGFEQLASVPFHEFSKLIKQLPKLMSLRGDQTVWQLVTKHLKNPKLQQAFSIQPLLVGGSPFDTTSIYGLIHYLERKHGIFFAMGGTGKLVEELVKLAKNAGVDFKFNTPIKRLIIEKRFIKSAETENNEIFEADHFVFNGDPLFLYHNLIDKKFMPITTRLKRDNFKLSMGLYVLFFGTSKSYQEVAHHTIVMGDTYKKLLNDIFHKKILSDDIALYLHRPTATDPSFAPTGKDSFYVLCPVPNNQSKINWSVEEPILRKKVIAALEKNLLPDLSKNIEDDFAMTPDDFEENYFSHMGAGFSIAPLFTQSAWFRFHNKAEGLKNLYLTGAGTHPGAGLPGVVSSAKVVEELVQEAERKGSLN